MEEEILQLLARHAAKGVDQGLTVAEIAQHLNADSQEVLAALNAAAAHGLAHQESFWWYAGPNRTSLLTQISFSTMIRTSPTAATPLSRNLETLQ